MLSWLNRRLRNRMSGGVRGRKSLNQRNFLLLDSFEAEKSKERIMLALSVIQGERSSS